MGFKRVTDVDELHTIIPTPQLSGGGQGLQFLSMTISLSYRQGKAGGGQGLQSLSMTISLSHADKVNSILLCTTHTLIVSLSVRNTFKSSHKNCLR